MNPREIAGPFLVLCLFSSVAIGQLGGPTPPSHTHKWSNESDLIAILDSASNRLTVAREIVAQCRDASLAHTDSERQDGFHIAGHTIYNLGKIAEARDVFLDIVHMGPVATTSYDVSDAWRMVGQARKAMSDSAGAFEAYESAYLEAQNVVPQEGGDYLSAYLLPFVADSAYQAGMWSDAVDYVDIATVDFTVAEIPDLPLLVELAGDASAEAGETADAIGYYTDFLSSYPDFESGDLLKSTRLRVYIKKLKQEGYDVFHDCNPQSIKKATQILTSEEYDGMLLRYSVGDSIAYCMRQDGQEWGALGLRRLLIQEVDDDLASPEAAANSRYMTELKKQQVQFLYKAAKLAIDLDRDLPMAAAMIDRIQTEFPGVDAYYESQATFIEPRAQPVP